MKCRSVACILSGTPPSHRVTATAILTQPPTLYTGGDNGSIIWWNLSGENSDTEIKPIGMLCGHVAPMVGLCICYPFAVSTDGSIDDSTNSKFKYLSPVHGSLISVCTDGALCVWSRDSGHCRRRRKLPPWVGSPSKVQTLPSNPRYVCIACCFIVADHLFGQCSVDVIEGPKFIGKEESQLRKSHQFTLVIVDSYTLSIVQTIFHGYLSIGLLKFMSIVTNVDEDMEKQSAIMIDSSGNSQVVPILKDSNLDGDGGAQLHKSYSQSDVTIWADGLSKWGNIVSVATCGQLFAFVYKTCCVFRLGETGEEIGEIQFSDNHVIFENGSTQADIIGGTFLESGGGTIISLDAKILAVWDYQGFAFCYSVSFVDSVFKFEPLYLIPAISCSHNEVSSFRFIMLNSLILRVESVCTHIKEPFLWKSNVSIWLPNLHVDPVKLWRQCKMFGESCFLVDMVVDPTISNEIDNPLHAAGNGTIDAGNGLVSTQNCIPKVDIHENIRANNKNYAPTQQKDVSSSMVISERFGIPYAVVYGFYNGEIELVQFDMLVASHHSCNESPRMKIDSIVSKHYFSGHMGAVLCLAAHQMSGMCKGSSFSTVLLSGSMDCTIRIWDLCSGILINIMHQHVAPVRQIILPPSKAERPWNDCFLSVGDDSCVSLASLETLRVERIFPGQPSYPSKVVWDSDRGYIACISRSCARMSEPIDVLYIWDIKTGAIERVLRGTSAHSMFDHFYRSVNVSSTISSLLNSNTSASLLFLPAVEDTGLNVAEKGGSSFTTVSHLENIGEPKVSQENTSKGTSTNPFFDQLSNIQSNYHSNLIKCACPFPGIASLSFDLSSLMLFFQRHETVSSGRKTEVPPLNGQSAEIKSPCDKTIDYGFNLKESEWVNSLEGCFLRFSLSFLHMWNVDYELDNLLITNLKVRKTDDFIVVPGLEGDRGSLTVTFSSLAGGLELWKLSSEFCAMRSLTMVSLALCMIHFTQINSTTSSALAAFYTRNFSEKIQDIMPPSLQILVSFWQDESEHVRMAARSLFHCAVSRAIPLALCSPKHKRADNLNFTNDMRENENKLNSNGGKSRLDCNIASGSEGFSEESDIHLWLEAYEEQDWISCVGGTIQDAMTSNIIVAAALAIWYPSIVKSSLSKISVHPLMKLVMAMNEKYSCTAAELLAEGMESTWKTNIGSEITHLIGDIFFQIECVCGSSNNLASQNSSSSASIRNVLVGILLPSLAMVDILGFLSVIENQIWSTASDSQVHLISLMTLIRVIHRSPKCLLQCLDKVVNFILQTLDPSNSVMRSLCLQKAMVALKEIVRIFPMVALNEKSTQLAVGDAIGEIRKANIRVYDMQSVVKVKVLDASGPLGLPNLIVGAAGAVITTVISALSFSPDGEGIVAFSDKGLVLRWWSLGSVWWEKLSRNLLPVQCTKLIFVAPWEGLSPTSSRSSIMESIGGDGQMDSKEMGRDCTNEERLKVQIQNVNLSYRLHWVGNRKVVLRRQGHELGVFHF